MAEPTVTPFGNGTTTEDIGYDACVGTEYMTYPQAGDFLFTIFHYNMAMCYVFSVGVALYFVILVMLAKLMWECSRIKDENIRGDMILCLSTPFIVATTCLVSAIFPRAGIQMTTFGSAYMMFALWRALALIFRLYGDTQHMSNVMQKTGTRIKLNVIPLCCCCCLPRVHSSLRNIEIIKYMVVQTPLIRLTIMAAIDVFQSEGLCDWTPETRVLNLIDSLSTCISLYASAVFSYASRQNLHRYRISNLMSGVTLTQVIFNLQRIVFDRLSLNDYIFPDEYFAKVNGVGAEVIEARVQADFWQNLSMQLWLLLISVLFLITMRPAKSELFTMDKIPIAHVDTEGNFPHLRSVASTVVTEGGDVRADPKGSINEGFDSGHHQLIDEQIEYI